MLRIVICDENKEFCKKLKGYVQKCLSEKGVEYEIDIYDSAENLIQQGVNLLRYTIVFLGLNIEGEDELDIARRIREKCLDIYIVLVASSAKYSLVGYQVEAIRYILKSDENLSEKVKECLDTVLRKRQTPNVKKHFKFCECEKDISINRIVYIESKLHKLEFHVMENEMRIYTMYCTLNELEQVLQGFSFLRVHQSFLVNMKYIRSLEHKRLLMDNEQIIVIPKARYQKVKNSFAIYQRKQ